MDTYTIDTELEHYYGDRMATSSREACRRFYLRAIAHCSGAELEKYLDKVRAHAAVYSSLSHTLRSPLLHVEMPLFLSSLVLFCASFIMALSGDLGVLVAVGTSAALVCMLGCARKLADNWEKHAVREAVFRELAEMIVRETT